ncbi:MAG: hypothetical protein ABIY70_22350 [Capsulimonas sp.]|uniref:hypothetical protein n=1 Tax=Capsulimonas sp. TaxID=2494211 RepID=UPI00326748B3
MQKQIKSTGTRLMIVAAGLGYIASTAAHAEEWKASEKAAAQLQPAQTFDGFSVRLPASAASPKIAGSVKEASKTYAWSLSPSDGKGGLFTISTRPAPGQTPDQILTEWTAQSVLSQLDEVGKSPVQTGTIGSDAFTRLYYHGREKSGAKSIVHGFVYIGVAQGRAFIIEAQDPTDKFAVTLPKTEAAALTLKPLIVEAAKPADGGKELSSDAHAADLGDAATVEGYTLRPPKGYTKGDLPMGDQGAMMTAWQGQPNEMGMRPMMIVQTAAVKKSSTAPVEDGMDAAVEMLRRFMPAVQVEAMQYGTVHGLECAHTSYTAAQNGMNFHGVIYSIHDGDKLVIVGGMDAAPNSDKSMPIMEAACQSIKKS